MKNLFLAFALITSTAVSAQSNTAPVDPASSKVMWTASKLTGEHTGVVSVKAGSITETKGVLTAAEITIDMTGITCIDIESPGTNAKLVAHLKSEDFFDVEQFGTASFVSTAIEALSGVAAGKPNYRVTGDLTIKGITEPNTFDCLFWTSDGAARAAATFTFDRAQYDVKFRSSTFFPEVGDKIISDTVSLTFDIAAK